jgi:hypothetical protein
MGVERDKLGFAISDSDNVEIGIMDSAYEIRIMGF